MRTYKCAVFLLITTLIISGCAINNKTFGTRNKAFEEGQLLIQNGELELGLLRLEQAAQEEPNNKEIRAVLTRQRDAVLGQMLTDAVNTRLSGDLDLAEEKFLRILDLFPRNERAQAGLDAVSQDRDHVASVEYAQQLLTLNDVDGAEKAVRAVLQENPMQPQAREFIKELNKHIARAESMDLTLETAFNKPLSMEFKDTELKSVFEIMSRTAGVNFVFDKDVRQEAKVSVFVRDNTVEDILKLLLMTNQLAYTRLNDNSLLIYPNTPAKQKEYQELMVRSFHVAYTDVKQMVAMVRGLVKAKDIYVNEQLNLFIMRDTLEAIRMVEKLVSLNDLPEPEIMLEVMILTVDRNNEFLLGPNLPQSTTFNFVPGAGTAAAAAADATVKLSQIDSLPKFRSFTIRNQVQVDFKHNISLGDVLANPRVRVKNRESAKFHIGRREPIFTSNVAAGVSAVVTSTPTFIDIGTKLDIEPLIGLNNDVTLKVQLEVSDSNRDVPAPDGNSRVPVIFTTNAETVLTLKDGETEVIAGLLEDKETRSVRGLAGLINIPGLDRLTSGQEVERTKREIVLLLTPRIIRNISQQTQLESEFHYGTANEAGKLPVRIRKTSAGGLALAPAGPAGRGGASSVLGRGAQAFSNDRSDVSPNPFAQQAALNASGEPTLTIQAPSNMTFEKEFSVRVRLVGARASVSGEAQVSYDSDMLELLDGSGNSGTHTIKFGKNEPSGMAAQLRFKVVTPNAGEAEISVQSATGEDTESGESIDIALPEPTIIKIQ
ncbi:secretin and TonB N-terminal domain-containing protein [Nitrosomonas sp.]|uniref:secretin and TonB N-terminal domain-containing protein n=1 Tax=Nitrosomonas sp. TaxID=42353 RepID=UPI00283B963A|nr:secretin and TonB N-terminal domain-containing protein [Nitrosomonas sp.]MDR4513764.1 secretin and TonB N-terminal domain-containing protein [Nitrosomonas sp.]